MEIRWYGQNSFAIKTDTVNLFVDPTEASALELIKEEDIVLTTHNEIKVDRGNLFDWPGEFETKEILMNSIALRFKPDEKRILVFEIEGVRFCNLGVLRDSLTESQIHQMGNIDVLFIPLTLDLKVASKIIEEIDPKMVIVSMQGSTLGGMSHVDLLKSVGQSGVEAEEKIVIKEKADLDTENIVFRLPLQN